MDTSSSEQSNVQTDPAKVSENTPSNFPKKKQLNVSDGFSRSNFLLQAGVATLVSQPDNEELVRYYMKCAKEIRAKKTLKWSRKIKRSICERCNMLLLPGVSSQVRLRKTSRMVITCLSCNYITRVNTNDPSKLTERRKKRNLKNKQRAMAKRKSKKKEKTADNKPAKET